MHMHRLFHFLIDPGPTLGLRPLPRLVTALALLAGRVWLALPFLRAGLHRLNSWDSQAYLFTEIHPVPFLPATISAPLTTGAEIVLGLALIAGLGGRAAAAGLGVMAAALFLVIGRTPQGLENGIALAGEQVPWIAAALVLTILGPGLLSLDAARRRLFSSPAGTLP
ncbi:DoxX family protein [Niveispirillum irakense]|uniref:DoxX family protein n=1 Tax=Niveispirillum irakense TaxID=34011 RepID=UPI000688608A|nr:DoxX family protein [Niveispirillum irakense]